jgi:ribosomal protein S18 acetylase RimI-like enzyme
MMGTNHEIDIQIRLAVATDLPRLMGMDHSIKSEYVWQLDLQRESNQVSMTLRLVRLPRTVRVEYPHDPYALADEWGHRSGMLVAVSGNNAPVGYIALNEQHVSLSVQATDLAVAPEMRRRGVGSALVLAAQDWASARGARRFILEMQSKNHAAVQLAQKLGYEFCGYNDQYYATQDVALFFGRMLK